METMMKGLIARRDMWVSITKLLHTHRMGSFTSTPRFHNEDCQDGDADVLKQMSRDELLEHCNKELAHLPPLVQRSFCRVTEQFGDTVAGVRVLQWNVLSKVCGEAVSSPYHIRILQWNVLSQVLGQENDNFVCCPREALDWNIRRYRMVQEIIGYCPDVICLQEVDHYNFLNNVLRTQGYTGMFFPKPDSPCLYFKGNNGPDGCAIFFRKNKFNLVTTESRILQVWRVESNQVAIMTVLRVLETGQELCVVSTHLKARKGALLATLRNEQGKDLLEFVSAHSGGRPVIICGDFNAEPTEPVYLTMLGHKLLNLASAYTSLTKNGEEPPYTTWKVREEGEVCHTIDYIFYSKKCFSVDAVLEFPSGEDIGDGRVPSFTYPSDHFSLVCDFQIKSECML